MQYDQTADTASIDTLRALAEQGRDKVEVHEGGSTIPIILLLWGLSFFMIAPALLMLAFAFKQAWWIALGGLAVGIGFILLGRMFWKRRTTPFLCISDAGLQYPDLARPIPWTDVQGYRVQAGQLPGQNLIMFVDLREGCHVPLRDPRLASATYSVRRVWFNPKEHCIVFKTLGVRGMSGAKLIELFDAYMQAGHARARLAALDYPGQG
ncbi:hypothetical protein [Xanthomonas medicagonis]|uniref:hypothetical protein n=1 Tax=Xanthomonas medicagonis TaxID=3160841 RepID=UPI003513093E